ncbi:2,4-dienoyl-CoA reductase-like NADH-dependent reductase (Old Yellow Enzyme family) [Nocardioides albertanoniae]|uniref:2,4-dienoyl-CoA reductase-like NADH-dependent reductase (Old Yellow Enzyme family) n=1 Tax=Nocardioides albertanoniae TaxID=1175486 RepID=A0A543A7D3_9ACTN|nr:NADH:flavin oxidoreductase [Nocardioides albertanoniae]TQL68498.1 2,4-dienoyl-CoA reductase-like NADH-dependent reductase (Old Yellow Enzyme family) [Nocardioides albertanoniae]
MSGPTPDPLAPARLGPLTLRNRVIKAATFEGASPGALVSDRLIDYHLAVAEGGVGMTTVAYLAVSPEGRTHADCIYWRPEVLPGLRRLTEEIHKTGAKVSAQIGHAGPVANAKSNGVPSLAPTRSFNALGMAFNRAATAEDLDRVVDQHADAARMALESGFDAIEVHLGHNYLPSSFLSPRLNQRTDELGGSLANRASFPRRILEAVRGAVGSQVAVLAKMNMRDGYRGGFDMPESVELARTLESDGHLDALELTGGSSFMNPMYLFRGDAPYREMAAGMPLHPVIKMGMRMVGKGFFKNYPYKPLYFLDNAREFRRALSMPLVLLGGVTDLDGMSTAMEEGFDYVAMARALLREPDLVNRIQVDRTATSRCIHCNLCMSTIYSGTHCHLDTDHVYGEAHPILTPGT